MSLRASAAPNVSSQREPGPGSITREITRKPPPFQQFPCIGMNEFRRTISREDVNDLPIRRYEGEVCLIESAEDLERAMADIRQERVGGSDTETRPAFRKGESHLP